MRVNAREVVGEIESSEGPGACVTLPSKRYRGGTILTPPRFFRAPVKNLLKARHGLAKHSIGQEARERLAEEDQRGDGVVSPHAGRVEGDGVAAVRRQHGPADRAARGFVRRWPRLVVGLRRPRGATTTWRFSREEREEGEGRRERGK